MNNLTTRKIVLGMLMALVLTFSVQGTADALNFTPTATNNNPSDSGNFSWMNVGQTIRLEISTEINGSDTDPAGSPDFTEIMESITVTVTGGGAKFLVGNAEKSSYEWDETDTAGTTDANDKITYDHKDADLPDLDLLIIVRDDGKVTVTISDSSSGVSSAYKHPSTVYTFYVVKDLRDVTDRELTTPINLLNVTNGVGAGYDDRQDIRIHNESGDLRVTYTVSDGGTLYIRDSNRYWDDANSNGVFDSGESYIKSSTTGFQTSSRAEVWLHMGNDSSKVTIQVTNSGIETQGIYIYGRPKLEITIPATGRFLEGSPGAVSQRDITVVVEDQTSLGADGDAVAGVPIKFDVVDKSATGGYLIPVSTADSNGFSTTIVDASNNLIRDIDVPELTRTLYVRTDTTNAVVGFQFGLAPGTSEVTISVSGTKINLREAAEVRVTGEATTTLTIESNTRRSGNSKLFELVAVVKRDGKALRGLPVTFQTRFGALMNTPTLEPQVPNALHDPTADDNSDGIDDEEFVADSTLQEDRLEVMELTDRLGKAQVIYDLGNNTGRQEIDASIYDTNPDLRQEVTFVVNGPAPPPPPPPPGHRC